jgi:hypothetical protein
MTRAEQSRLTVMMNPSYDASTNGKHGLVRSRLPVLSSAFELSLAACLTTLRFEANQATFQRACGRLRTIRDENRLVCDVAARSREAARRAIAWSVDLRDARAARPA